MRYHMMCIYALFQNYHNPFSLELRRAQLLNVFTVRTPFGTSHQVDCSDCGVGGEAPSLISSPALPPPSTLTHDPINPIPLMPVIDLAPHILPIHFILRAALDKELGAVLRAAKMAFQVLPSAVWFEHAARVGTAIRAQSLFLS